MASAIATGLSQGFSLPKAVARAQAYVVAAIRGAPGYGSGHGPIDHGHTVSALGGPHADKAWASAQVSGQRSDISKTKN